MCYLSSININTAQLDTILPTAFYLRDDVVSIARELLGKVLVTSFGGVITSGIITETEAYAGVEDKASHAYGGKVTERNKIMYANGGVTYVYLCYGLHHLFNVVTNMQGIPHAVLIRGAAPIEGIPTMLIRRNKTLLTPALTAGPGALAAAMGITKAHNGLFLQGPQIVIRDVGMVVNDAQVMATTRVGVAYAGEDALLPYRFYLKDNKYVSKAKGSGIRRTVVRE